MNIRGKNWIVSLTLLLAFSLAIPFCCHLDTSKIFAHQQDFVSGLIQGSQQGFSDCGCGHELSEVFRKTKQQTDKTNTHFFSGIEISGSINIPVDFSQSSLIKTRIVEEFPRPSLHLLYSVFLN